MALSGYHLVPLLDKVVVFIGNIFFFISPPFPISPSLLFSKHAVPIHHLLWLHHPSPLINPTLFFFFFFPMPGLQELNHTMTLNNLLIIFLLLSINSPIPKIWPFWLFLLLVYFLSMPYV